MPDGKKPSKSTTLPAADMTKIRKIELLAPAKNVDIAIEAIKHGADAVYIGASKFGARASAGNSIDDIAHLVDFAHIYNARIYATVNTIVYDSEIRQVEQLIKQLYRASVDALIVQDMGILRMDIPPIQLHASTQCDTRTPEKAKFLESVGFSQIVLARELTQDEIARIAASVSVPIECFVHGALCVSYSGRCNASCAFRNRSANRGECAQLCRLPYDVYADGKPLLRNKHILSLQDFNQSDRIEQLLEAGASSLKIEGRLKDMDYVKNVTAYYSQLLDRLCLKYPDKYQRASAGKSQTSFTPNLEKSFNRGFTHYFFDKRTSSEKMASLNSPKSIGEKIGVTKACSPKNGITIDCDKTLANGDGIIFFNSRLELVGFRANKVVGNAIKPLEKINIPKGTVLYRNFDKQFSDLLSKETATRKLALSVVLHTNKYGITTEMADETGCKISLLTAMEAIDAAKSNQYAPQRKVFEKLGDTPFYLADFNGKATENLFIPASVLSNLRRNAINAQLQAITISHRFEYRKEEDKSALYPSKSLAYSDNVANRLANQFYTEHGVTAIEPAMEISDRAITNKTVLMTTRYCIRRELGCCLKSPDGRKFHSLTLQSGDIKMEATFDCKNCQMLLCKVN